MKKLISFLIVAFIVVGGIYVYTFFMRYAHEVKVLKQVVERLQADSRIADVLVTKVQFDETKAKNVTTIKLLEYDSKGRPLVPKYFTFSGNIIQFQSLVIRFDDIHIRRGDLLRGKSAYLLWKVFMLDGSNTQEYEITKLNEIPVGYKVENLTSPFEATLWRKFWDYALDAQTAKRQGIKNAQIEAPGTIFVPGTLYTLKIEHDGGIRIDAEPLPSILRGETIP